MRTIRVVVIALAVVCGVATPAKAQVVVESPGLATLISNEIALATKSVMLQLKEAGEIVALVSNAKFLLESANEALAVARSVKRVYEMLKNYSLEDLLADAKAGLFEALPELRDVENEWNELQANGRAMQDGKFWKYRSRKDLLADNRLASTASLAWRAGVYGAVAPELYEGRKKEATSEAEKWVQYYFARANMRNQRALQNSVFSIQAEKLRALVADAEAKEQTDLRIATQNATATHQNAVNSQFLRDAKAAEIARILAQQQRARELREADEEELRESKAPILGVGLLD